jgi:hypothetical protein
MTADVNFAATAEIPVLSGTLHVYSIDQLLQLQYSPLVSKPAAIVDLRALFPAVSQQNSSAGPARVKRYVPPNGRGGGNVNTHANGNLNQKYVTPNHRNDNKYEATRKIDFSTKSTMNRDSSLSHNNNNGYSLEDDDEEDPQWLEPGDSYEMPVATDHSVEEFERWKAEMKARDGLADSSPVQPQTIALELPQPPQFESKQSVEASIFSNFFPISPENNKAEISHSTKTDNDFFLSLLNKQESVQQKTLPDSPVSVKDDPIYADTRRSSDGRTNSNSSMLSNTRGAPPPGLDYTFFPPQPGLTQQPEEFNSDSNVLINGKNSDRSNRNDIPLSIDENIQNMPGFLPGLPPYHHLGGLPHQGPPPSAAYEFPAIHLPAGPAHQDGPGGPGGPSPDSGFMGYGPLPSTPDGMMGFPILPPGPRSGFDPRGLPPHLQSQQQPLQQQFDGSRPPHQFDGPLPPPPMGLLPHGIPHHYPMAGMPPPPLHIVMQGPGTLGMGPPPPGFFEFSSRVDEKSG